MMQYVADYFAAHPQLEAAFETPDMVLHPSEEVAKSWVERKWPNHITKHNNPAFAAPAEAAPAEGDPGDEQP